MHVLEHTYVSLLADVANLTGFSEIRGSYVGLQWCLNEAPKLEKHILECIELGRNAEIEMFPDGLRRLAAGSVSDPVQLRYLRQLLLFCYKATVTHDITIVEKSFQAFLETNSSIERFGSDLGRVSPLLLDRTRRHCQSVLHTFREKGIKPSHGPGAVTNSKERWRNRFDTIESIYPYSDWYYLYYNREHLAQLEDANYEEHITAKLIAVPKDTRGPRLICVHPAEAIWLQQGIRRELERCINVRRKSNGPWPCGHIHFDDQRVNGQIALCSSRSGKYATIDMKEASDRISEPLVQILFGRKYKYFGCCRAQKVTIPKLGSVRNLVKDIHSYAPMGNATTFPVQSLVFWAICVASLQRQGVHHPGAVFVFGDDIIIPSENAEEVINDLESFGLLVNRTKSFWRGAFRESCGVDAFKGVDVTPVRWKTTIDAEYTTDLQALSDIGMRLRIAGYEEASITTYQTLRMRLYDQYGVRLFLTNNPTHGGIAEFSFNDISVWRDSYWNRDLQWYHSRVWRLQPPMNSCRCDDWNHVLESVCSLERTGSGRVPTRDVSRRLWLSRGWIPVL